MGRLLLFNPENDLALAANARHFTAPRVAAAMRRAGRVIPYLVAAPGDGVLDGNSRCDAMESFLEALGVDTVNDLDGLTPAPWGWSRSARCEFERAGVGSSLLPDEATLDVMRNLSHRRISATVMDMLQGVMPLPPNPCEISDAGELDALMELHGRVHVKSPWSSSGRGVMDSASMPYSQLRRLALGMIGHQGSVMVEKSLDKVVDFAVLYDCTAAGVAYNSLSVFHNSSHSIYGGNIVAPDDHLRSIITHEVDGKCLDRAIKSVGQALGDITRGKYHGPVGVDMMVYRDDAGNMFINPCVEVNLRMTMGRVAAEISRRYLAPGTVGLMGFKTSSSNASDTAQSSMHTLQVVDELKIDNKKLKQGCISFIDTATGLTFHIQVGPN